MTPTPVFMKLIIYLCPSHIPFSVLDSLIDTVGENENHPLASLMEVIGVLIVKYEDEHIPELTNI